MKKILIALDYNPTAQKVAEDGFALAKAMQATAVLLHVVPDSEYYKTALYSPIMGFGGYVDMPIPPEETANNLNQQSQEFLDKTKTHLGDATIETIVSHGDVADAIKETIAITGANVVVMGSHSRRWLESVLLGSVTEKVLRRSNIPLFIIPTNQQE